MILTVSHALRAHYPDPGLLRGVAFIAGKVMTVPEADEDTVVAAWMYRICEKVASKEIQDAQIEACRQTFNNKVASIIESMVCPPGATQEQLNTRFVTSLPPAKIIRVCECIVSLHDIIAYLYGGSFLKLNDAKLVLDYSQHVYKNSVGVDKDLRAELLKGFSIATTLYVGIRCAAEGIENVLGPSPQCGVTILALTNDLGTVTVRASTQPHPEPSVLRQIYDAMRLEIGGTLFSESLYHITVPLPKISTGTLVPAPPEP